MKSKVLVLGADTFQIGLLKYLKKSGYETHVVSNRASDPGIGEAHFFHEFSYMEMEKVLSLYKSLNAVQIFSVASDASIHCQSFVQEELGLPGYSRDFINFFSDKSIYKSKLKAINSGYIPDITICSNNEQLQHFYSQFTNGIIVKPRTSSGSKNVTHIKTREDLATYKWKGNPSEYIAEEFIEGAEVGGDFFIYKNQVTFYWPTIKKVNRHKVPSSHLVLQKQNEELVLPFLNYLNNTLALPDGVYNVDIILKQSKPYLIDFSPRIGGNCIPNLIYLSTGINEWEFMTSIFTAQTPPPINPAWQCPHGVYIIGSEKTGTLKNIVRDESPFANHIVEICWKVKPGDPVQEFTQGGKHLGYVIYKASSDDELLNLQQKIESFSWFSLQ